ncbi:hypothetical protein [Paenibacillus prosopidis]|uniref:Uncharacterized protein n=1 Tax=Paenibacillus prosopidis TaxID=630520 RepID=A0A368VEX1_9BACL|nr:hypothetical protein [Paenibacillus prosopidis]RCW39612.1 hypothetical protein DFP97_1623 [Paenibacillus prosopidis]
MKTTKFLISLIVVFISVSFILLLWIMQQNKPLYDQIGKVISESDSGYSELIHIHADRERTIAFYLLFGQRTRKGKYCLKLVILVFGMIRTHPSLRSHVRTVRKKDVSRKKFLV